jgi:hypothetical protein
MSHAYASIALFEVQSDKVAIATLSVTTEECVLSGGWLLPLSNLADVKNVLTDKLTLPASTNDETKALIVNLKLNVVNFSDFLKDAGLESKIAIEQYEEFKAEQPGKRKNLVVPDFYSWPSKIDVLDPKTELKKINMQENISGTAPEMEQVLSAARLVKFFIEKWISDETERSNRKFVQGEAKLSTPLPLSWMH